jgi:hypothetical protein
MIPVFERANTFHALDRAATAVGRQGISQRIFFLFMQTHFYTSAQGKMAKSDVAV